MTSAGLNGARVPLTSNDLRNDAFFVRAVTQMGDAQELRLSKAIFSEAGQKLLEAGARVDSSVYELLVQHRLSTHLDDHLVLPEPLDIPSLQARVLSLATNTLLGRLLVRWMGEKHVLLWDALRYMKWQPRASVKLAVMRHELPELLEHSILMMMVSIALAVREGVPVNDCGELAAAALLHDVGMLYMPRSWTQSNYKLSPVELQQLSSHSTYSMLVVRSTTSYSGRAEDAVLEHHERLDGSGYPNQLRGREISHWGCILMMAEVVSSFFSKFHDIPAQRLSVMLRMNHSRFDAKLMQHVFQIMAPEMQANPQVSTGTNSPAEVHQIIATLSAVFQYWSKCKRRFPEKWQTLPGGRAGVYVEARMGEIARALAESGSHPHQHADWLAMFEEDPSSMGEVVLINKEALWQMDRCVENCIRRWPQLLRPSNEFDQAMYDWLASCRKVLGAGAASEAVAS